MSSKKDGFSDKSDAGTAVVVGADNKQSSAPASQTRDVESLDYSDIVSKITDHLYLTGLDAINESNFKKYGFTCDINISQRDDQHPNDVDYLHINLLDEEDANIAPHFDTAADKIHEIAEKGGKTVVHCVVGMSRSASLTIAYLMKYQKMTLREAFNYIHVRRPIIRPNNGFFRQLLEYEKKILGNNSVKMVTVRKKGVEMEVPDFFVNEHPKIIEEDFDYCFSLL